MEHSLKKPRPSQEVIEESKRTDFLDAAELLESILHEELAKEELKTTESE